MDESTTAQKIYLLARAVAAIVSARRSDLILINGCLCCNLSLYADCPECIGASCKGELLCCVQRFCFKFGVPPLTCCESFVDKEVCCQVGLCCCAIGVKCPSTRVTAQKHRPSVDVLLPICTPSPRLRFNTQVH